MKRSITAKYTMMLTGLLIFTLLTCWGVNRTFLVKYYQERKCKALEAVFDEIKGIVEEIDETGMITADQSLMIERIGSYQNVSIYILKGKYYRYLVPVYPSGSQLSQDQWDRMRERWRQYVPTFTDQLFGNNENDLKKESLILTPEYEICKVKDAELDLSYIDLKTTYNNEYSIFLRTNYDSIEENVALANKFLAYVGIIATIIGTILMYFTSRRMTKPIKQLNEVAKNMSNLNFDAKYTVSSKDEIGELGSSINILSERLETTISELKRANNVLKNDIAKKNQIDEMRKEFLSNVTHELKTPIALIQGYAEGLLDNINDDQESKDFYCEVIVDEANKMNAMVKKLLTLNQLEFGNDFVEFNRFDLIPVIRSVLASTDILLKQKNITLHFEAEEPVYVWADEYLVEEVLTNYISNAINHISGTNVIEIKVFDKKDVVRVAVYNTGERIPLEDLEKIWIKFYKVDKARTREYGGSGIGLSIVKAIMNSMNRECGVVNHEHGVEFWFELDRK